MARDDELFVPLMEAYILERRQAVWDTYLAHFGNLADEECKNVALFFRRFKSDLKKMVEEALSKIESSGNSGSHGSGGDEEGASLLGVKKTMSERTGASLGKQAGQLAGAGAAIMFSPMALLERTRRRASAPSVPLVPLPPRGGATGQPIIPQV